MDEQDSSRRRRETPADVTVRRAARLLVDPLHDQLSIWQSEMIKLEAMAQRARAAGRDDTAVAAARRAMLGAISDKAAAFEADLSVAPEAVRSHSRVTDARKVLRLLEERLGRLGEG